MSTKSKSGGPDDANWVAEEAKVLAIRLSLAQAFVQMLQEGYDALLNHSINYRNLQHWKESKVLDTANTMPIEEGQVLILGWVTKLQSEIRAAVRRKNMRVV